MAISPSEAASARRTAATTAPARGGGASREAPIHIVKARENLYRIALAYGVDVGTIKQANELKTDLILEGQSLVIPGGRAPVEGVTLGTTFSWPLVAPVSSYFGPRWGRQHKGIDLAANQGDEIRASRDGEVWVAGEVPGYGQTVIIAHADGSQTLYGHCSKLLVKPGQKVKQGQVIALVGSTGQSTGPHLHFEIILNDQPTDPLPLLPKR